MSLSKPRVSNARPVKKYIKWNGAKDKGYFSYWDKEANGGKGSDIKVDLKNLIVLDQDMFSITGFRDRDKVSFQSNEVRGVDDVLKIVQWKDKNSKEYKQGTYRELKEEVKDSQFLNYTKCIYAMLDGDPVHIQLKGNAAWQFGKPSGSGTHETHYLSHTSTQAKDDKTIAYTLPIFSYGDRFDPEDFENAVQFDSNKLQPYLEAYLSGTVTQTPDEDHSQEVKEEQFDIKQWRKFKLESGKHLGELTRKQIIGVSQDLENEGVNEGVLLDCIGQALHDYQQAEKTWEQLKDRGGRLLTDYSAEEMQAAYDQVSWELPVKIKLEIALESAKEKEKSSGLESSDDWEDEVAPF